MRSSFLEFSIASSGLYTSMTSLNVSSHNISNANTEGYSRQVVTQKATRPMVGAGKGMLGTGTEVVDITQIRDFYLDTKFWNQNSKLGDSEIKQNRLKQLEMLFNEPSDSGINAIQNKFFGTLQTLSKDTSDASYYSNVKEAAKSFVGFFNQTATAMTNYQGELNNEVKIKVNQINSISFQIKSLNEQIYRYEISGNVANDLRDQRANLVNSLSKLVNVEVNEVEMNDKLKNGVYNIADRANSDKHYIIKVNGQVLVDHFDAYKLEVVPRESKNNPEDIDGLYDVRWSSGLKFDIANPKLDGELKACIDLRDGNNGETFKADITDVDTVLNRITVSNFKRADLPDTGVININGTDRKYNAYFYDETNNEITFELDDVSGVNITDKAQIGKDIKYKGIPHYLNRLNEFVRTFARAFNEGERSDGSKISNVLGNKNGYSADGTTGNYMFAYKKGNVETGKGTFENYNKITALNFSLAKEFEDEPRKIAVSVNSKPSQSENVLIHQFLNIKNDVSLFNEGKIQDYIAATIGELAVDSKQAETYNQIQSNIINSIENQRTSNSGVDLNEEMSNMVKFKNAYSAAAKLMTVIDEIYDITINNMGAR